MSFSSTVCQRIIILLILAVDWFFDWSPRGTPTIMTIKITSASCDLFKVSEEHVKKFSVRELGRQVEVDKASGGCQTESMEDTVGSRSGEALGSSLRLLTLTGFPNGRLTSTTQTPE